MKHPVETEARRSNSANMRNTSEGGNIVTREMCARICNGMEEKLTLFHLVAVAAAVVTDGENDAAFIACCLLHLLYLRILQRLLLLLLKGC